MRPPIDLTPQISAARRAPAITTGGTVERVIGLTIEVAGLAGRIGELCYIYPDSRAPGVEAEIVGFRDQVVLLMPFGELHGIQPGSLVEGTGDVLRVPVGEGLLGRTLDGLGRPLDRLGPLAADSQRRIYAEPPSPLRRKRITERLSTGVRAVDSLLTVGKGQRMGIFSGSGVGKSTLLGMIARGSTADVNVIALIGERGREVRDFIERDLGEEGMSRSVVVVSTSDQAALNRIRGAYVATTIAEYFRDLGKHVVLFMDSVTRFAMAQREVGLASGEPPASKGYTPSVFALLPKLMERAGNSDRGSITGFYTVLVEGDDLTEPVTDTARSILDGHVTLSRDLAGRQHYPAIDFMDSISRAMPDVAAAEHLDSAARFRETYATYEAASDLIDIGAYQAGSNPRIDHAIRLREPMLAFLRQRMTDSIEFESAMDGLSALFPPGGMSQSTVEASDASGIPAAGPVLDPLQMQYFRPESSVPELAVPATDAAESVTEAPRFPDSTPEDFVEDELSADEALSLSDEASIPEELASASETEAGSPDTPVDEALSSPDQASIPEGSASAWEADPASLVDEAVEIPMAADSSPELGADSPEAEPDEESAEDRAQAWVPDLLDDDEFLAMMPAESVDPGERPFDESDTPGNETDGPAVEDEQ